MINSPEELFEYMKNNIKFGFYSGYDKGIHIRNKEDKMYNKRRDYGLNTTCNIVTRKTSTRRKTNKNKYSKLLGKMQFDN